MKTSISMLASSMLALASCNALNPFAPPEYRGELILHGEEFFGASLGGEISNELDARTRLAVSYFEFMDVFEARESSRIFYFVAPSSGDFWFSAEEVGCGAARELGKWSAYPKKGVVPANLSFYNKQLDVDVDVSTTEYPGLEYRVSLQEGERLKVGIVLYSNYQNNIDWIDENGNCRIYVTVGSAFVDKKYEEADENEVEQEYRNERFEE